MKNNVTKHTFVNPFIFFMGSILAISLTGCDTPAAPDEQEEQANITSKTKTITTDSGLEIKMTDLGALTGMDGRTVSGASSINNNNQIVGGSTHPESNNTEAVKWEDGEIVTLGDFPNDGSSSSYAISINDNGEIILYSGLGDNYLLSDNSLKSLRNIWSVRSINNNGQITGNIRVHQDSHSYAQAVIWENGEITKLGTLCGHDSTSMASYAYAINNNGQVVGYSHVTSSKLRAFLWENGTMSNLGTLENRHSYAYDINDKGMVVGASYVTSYKMHAFLWENGMMTDLGALEGGHSTAQSINEHGQIVGWSYYKKDSKDRHAVLWLDDGTIIDLGTLGGEESVALSINENGQIVGWAETSSGEGHAVLWEIME